MASSNHLRSASYPPQSNPILQKIEDELIKLRTSEASSTSLIQSICIGLKGLARLYSFVDDVLSLPLLAHQNISQNDTQLKPLIQGSSRLLEICSSSKQMLGRLVEALGLLQSSGAEAVDICSYFACRKEVAKKAKGAVSELREIEERLVSKSEFNEELEVIRVLRCVSIINISVLESLLRFISMPLMMSSKVKSTKFALFSMLGVRKLGKGGNELSNLDALLHEFDEDVARKRLEGLEQSFKGIEDGLNNMFKQLTKTRASLMNLLSV